MGEEILEKALELAQKIIDVAESNGYSKRDLLNTCCLCIAMLATINNIDESAINMLIDAYRKLVRAGIIQADKSKGGE